MKKKTLITIVVCVAIVLVGAVALYFGTQKKEEAIPTMLEQAHIDGKQVVSTLTFVPGEEISETPAIADLFKTLAFQWASFEDYGALSLLMEGEEVFTANMKADENGVFVQADSLDKKPMYFAMEDLQAFVTQMMKESGADSAAIAQMENSFQASMLAGAKTQVEPKDVTKMTDEELREFYTNAFGGDQQAADWVMALVKRAVVTEGKFTDPSHDPANSKLELTITKEDILALMDTDYMFKTLKGQLSASYPTSTAEELDQKVKDAIAEAKKELSAADISFPITALKKDDVLVSFTMPGVIKNTVSATGADSATASTTEINATVSMDYNRLTTGEKVAHAMKMAVAEGEKSVFSIDGSVDENKSGSYDLSFVVDVPDEDQITIKGNYTPEEKAKNALLSIVTQKDNSEILLSFRQTTLETTVDSEFSIYAKDAPAETMVLAEDDKPLITFKVNAEVKDADTRFDALKDATPETSTQVLKLSSEEMKTFSTDLSANGMQLLYTVMAKLPASVFDLFMNQMQTTPGVTY